MVGPVDYEVQVIVRDNGVEALNERRRAELVPDEGAPAAAARIGALGAIVNVLRDIRDQLDAAAPVPPEASPPG